MKKITVNTDGGSRGNPGPAATGIIIKDENGAIINSFGHYIGNTTNNDAEYQAVIHALTDLLLKKLYSNVIEFILDSELVVKQINGIYKVKNPLLKEHYNKIQKLKSNFANITFKHVKREFNTEPDAILNQILDKAGY